MWEMIKEQIALAERNRNRCSWTIASASLLGVCLGFLCIWLFELQPMWAVLFAVFGGACGYLFHEITLKKRAKCPSCGGSWEMELLNQRCIPNDRFYLTQ